MAKLEKIHFLEKIVEFKKTRFLQVYWDNQRAQEIMIEGDQPKDLVAALYKAARLIEAEIANKQI